MTPHRRTLLNMARRILRSGGVLPLDLAFALADEGIDVEALEALY